MRVGRLIWKLLPPALLAGVALGSWRAANQADFAPISAEPEVYERALQTPMLSARRLPMTLRAPISDELIRNDVNAVIANAPSNQTCLVVRNGDRVLGNPTDVAGGLVPASNQKLITTWAALGLLEEDFRFETEVASEVPAVDGVIDGDLYLIGDGDPFLYTDDWLQQYADVDGRSHTRLEDLADRVAEAGITAVNGTVVGDETLYDAQRYGPWDGRLIDQKQSGPISALTLNEGFAVWPAEYPNSPRPRVPADNPPLQAASTFGQLLQERGITIGGVQAGAAPPTAIRVASIQSPPLVDTVTHINSYSSNIGAELLLKRMGLFVSGQASTEAGAAVVTGYLEGQGVPMDDLDIRDGSGLSEDNRLTCAALATILDSAGPETAFGRSLSISGERGSLLLRFNETSARSLVLAKTGSLRGVSALSGYVLSDPADGEDGHVTFSLIVNDDDVITEDQTVALQEPFLIALTGYPAGPGVADLSPRPTQPVN